MSVVLLEYNELVSCIHIKWFIHGWTHVGYTVDTGTSYKSHTMYSIKLTCKIAHPLNELQCVCIVYYN